MPSTSTNTLARTLEWSKRFTYNRPGAIGNFLEPGMTNANIIAQTILGAPFSWRWNRATTGFITIPGQQDYFIFNWSAGYNLQANSFTIDTNGNVQRATIGGYTGTGIPIWNMASGGLTTDGNVTWVNQGALATEVSPIYNFAWIETVALMDVYNTPPRWKEIREKICLGLDSVNNRPEYISAQGDDGQGNITFRMMPVPDKAYPVAITIQQKPINFTSVNQTWAPIPDEYAHIYNWGFLALQLLFADDPRFQSANQKFIASLLSTNNGLTDTELNIVLNNWQMITGQPVERATRQQQGTQVRTAL